MKKLRVGVSGTGFIAQGFIMLLAKQEEMTLSKVLTRRKKGECVFTEEKKVTNHLEELIDSSDLVVECSGDAIHATSVVSMALSASLPVVTMNAEFHVTTGSYFTNEGLLTEAEGDQPGCLAALNRSAIQMGFEPVVYGNIKGFLNHNPTLEDMIFWSKKSGISLQQVTSFTDGTKVQIEQALVANGLGATIAKSGLLGISAENDNDIKNLAVYSERMGCPISDYILAPKYPAGIFILAKHSENQKKYLQYYKMGEGPYYLLLSNFHLCHLEIFKTIKEVILNKKKLLNNSKNPTIGIAAIAKRDILQGEIIEHGIGSFDFRGEAVKIRENINHVPIGLLKKARIVHNIEKGQTANFDSVEIPDSLALYAYRQIIQNQIQ